MTDDLTPTPEDQWSNYRRRMQTYDVLLEQWKSGGRIGPPPPRPVRPHIPAFQIPDVPAGGSDT